MRQKLLTSDDADWVLKSMEDIYQSLGEEDLVSPGFPQAGPSSTAA
jgi:hypothetical protein